MVQVLILVLSSVLIFLNYKKEHSLNPKMKVYLCLFILGIFTPIIGASLMGIGYHMDPSGWGDNSPVAMFLIKFGGTLV